MMKPLRLLPILLLVSCASIVDGSTQDVTINTNPPGANCSFMRDGEVLPDIQTTTPGTTHIKKTKDDLTVKCAKDGYQETSFVAHSGIDDWTWGNILIGGLIGWGIDSSLGADNYYDTPINIDLTH